MYNADIKEEYTRYAELTSSTARTYLTLIFKRTAAREQELKKDLYDWNTQEIITFYKMQFYTSYSTVNVLNTMLSSYTEYCLRHNLVEDSQNHYDELSTQTLLSCVNTALLQTGIFTREQLLSNIEGFTNVGDKFLVLGLFEGLMGAGMSDFWNIYPEDIHGNMITLPATQRELLISNELVRFARESAEEYVYYPFLSADPSEQKCIKNFKDDDPRVLKAMWNAGTESDVMMRRRMMNRLARLTRADEQPYRRALLMESGRIHSIKEYMKQDGITDFAVAYKNHIEELEYRYNRIYDFGRWILQYKKFFE